MRFACSWRSSSPCALAAVANHALSRNKPSPHVNNLIDPRFARRSVELAISNVEANQRPFGAVVVRRSVIVAEAVNTAALDHDPTAHAEMRAIRAAATTQRSESLDDCVIYASCEPCVMCAAAIRWSNLGLAVYCVEREVAEGYGFADVVEPPLSRHVLGATNAHHLEEFAAFGRVPFERWRTRR